MPRLTLRRPRGVYLPSLQHPCGPKTTRGFNQVRACTGPTQPYYAARNRASAGRATNCSRNAYAGWPAVLAAHSFLLTTNPSDSIFGDVLGALQTLARAAGYFALPTPRDVFLTALAKAALPPRVVAALDELQQSLHCAPPSHLRDSRWVWQETLHHSHRDSAHVIWRAYGRSSLLPFSWSERLAQAGSRYSRPSKMQVTFSPHAVPLCLVQHPMAPVQLLVRLVSMVEHRLKDRWNNNRGIRRQHIHSLRTWILKACKLP